MKRMLQAILIAAALVAQFSRASEPRGRAEIRDNAQAVAALVKIGVPLERDTMGRVRWIEAVHGEINDEALRQLPGLPLLEWLEIGGGKITQSGVAHLKDCSQLRRLYIHEVRLTDRALSFLGNLQHLEALSLRSTGITGKGLKHLRTTGPLRVLNLTSDDISDQDLAQVAKFESLEVLALQDTKITGAGLANLGGMKRLNVLNLIDCPIGDGDVECFTSMPNLRIVHAAGCNISEKAIEDFKERLPMLAIFK